MHHDDFSEMVRTRHGGTEQSQAADSTGGPSGWRSGPEPLSQNSWGQTHCLSGGYRALCSSWLLLGLVLRSVVLESWLHCSRTHLSPFTMPKHLFPCFLPPVEQHGFLHTELLMPRVLPGLVLSGENRNRLIDLLIFVIVAFERKSWIVQKKRIYLSNGCFCYTLFLINMNKLNIFIIVPSTFQLWRITRKQCVKDNLPFRSACVAIT